MNPQQKQGAGDDSTNIQVGRDLTIHQGIDAEHAREIALAVFHENFMELRGAAEDVARGRAEQITTDFIQSLQNKAPQALNSAADPDMQRAIFVAQREYACSGDEDLETVLVDLLVDRATETTRGLRTIVLNEAISAAPKLTPQQRRVIAFCFIVRYSQWQGQDVNGLYDVFIRQNLLPLCDDIPTKATAYQHIEYVGAGSVGLGSLDLVEALRHNYHGLFSRGLSPTEIPEPLREHPQSDRIFMPAVRDTERVQVRARTEEDLKTLISNLAQPELEPPIRQAFNLNVMQADEIQAELLERIPEFEAPLKAWRESSLQSLTLTSVGIAIGHGYWRRVTGGAVPLLIWISD